VKVSHAAARDPKHWVTAKVADVGEIQLGRQRSPEHHQGPHMRPYLRVANVYEDRINTRDVHRMNFTPTEFATYALRPGDILLNEGQSLELVGRAAMYRGEVPGACFQNTLIRFRCKPGIHPSFALLQFRWFLHTQRFQKISKWTTSIAHLGVTRFVAMDFSVPPAREQVRIAEEVEKQFTRLSAAVAAFEKVKANLKRYRASVLKAACEGRLVPTEAELARREGRSFESGEALLRRVLGDRAEEPPGSAARRPASPPPLPNGWTSHQLRGLAEIKGGLTKGQVRPPGTKLKAVPYLRVANVQRGYLDLAEMKQIDATEGEVAALRLQPGDVLFNEGGDRDKLGRGWVWNGELPTCIHQNHVFRARLRSTEINPRFVSWYGNAIGQKYFMEQGKQTTNLASINLTKLGSLPVPLPPAAEQRRIVEEVERRLSVVDELEATVEKNLARCARLRQAIFKLAFEGRLVPQDLKDEPASVLLDRIRKERETVAAACPPRKRQKAARA
jgi:type I restriction enzyme S subunit